MRGYRHPGRAATRNADEARARSVCFHDEPRRIELVVRARNFAAKGLAAEADACVRELRTFVPFKPYTRPFPRIAHKRGAARRALARYRREQAAA